MTSSRDDEVASADLGLLSPVTAGTAVEPLTSDAAVAGALVEAEAALFEALLDSGIAPASTRPAVDRLRAARVSPRHLALEAGEGGNPVIPLVPLLREAAGSRAADWVHYGATSQDILDTALVLVARDTLGQVTADLGRLHDILTETAHRLRDAPAVARTLSQQALPTTMGFRAAGWLTGVREALESVRAVHLPVSLGGPVGVTAAYGDRGAEVLEAYADRLGLSAPPASWHTRRHPLLSVAAAAGSVAAACGTLATDVVVLGQTEVGEVREGHGGPSSSMPHKNNPAQSVLVLSATRQVPFLGATLTSCAVTGTERPAGAWHAEWQPLRTLLRLTGAIAERSATLAEGLLFDEVAMRRNLDALTQRLGADPGWVQPHATAAAAWVDRVLGDTEGGDTEGGEPR